ncbi:hypothetical protein F5X68DRAFT_175032 [Plectosphaerella plurivora]|uniref:Protein NO VEIN C-terminal domain-containing protein n=1 Tax=Plectosphaerella plurivora TaxID=936078 RepID=A0A9P8V4G7_9PEZI|nr:hypothetical protein F5X68DRAFT_175032 [Plectosphaerella plurivora]
MTSPKDAKDAVLAIGREFGHFENYDEIMESMGQWNRDIRRTIEESFLARDTRAAHSIKTLAKNIYGSDARFVFELLQNADDNLFARASASGEQPRIAFHVYPRRIVVECNEDGFTKENLRAICAVGESTKSTCHGYIGAKGIGFKSVFIAAWKVSIQSGHFSFYFKHEKTDLGLGMVTPVWEDPKAPLPGPMTRMTLHLHERGDARELERLRSTIFRQLSELQQTSLLFLRNLRQIAVVFYDEGEQVASSKTFRVGSEKDHKVMLETTSLDGGRPSVDKKLYHRTSYIARNLARSEGRGVPEDADEGVYSESEVVLAFPLTSDLQPLIERQELFAFLPIRESGFKFLIQADFDTSASRQDIVTTSLRNANLRDAIADAFIKAVLQFCEHPLLCFTWPLFLPSQGGEHADFWSGLSQRIKDLVQITPLLKSRHRRCLRFILDVFSLTPDFMGSNGQCLLDDSAEDPYISSAYPRTSVDSLLQYGLRWNHYDVTLRLLEADLESPSSRMKSHLTSQEWHSAMAKTLTSCLARFSTRYMPWVRRIALLPLRGGIWVAADSSRAYLPTTDGVPIPPGIDLQVLDPAAVSNADRRTLFAQLGATEAEVTDVRNLVLKSLVASYQLHVYTVVSMTQLLYLYRTHRHYTPGQKKATNEIALRLSNGGMAKPYHEDVYLPTENHPYGPTALMDPNSASSPDHLRVKFLHADYLESFPVGEVAAWKTWLHDTIGIRRRLRLVSRKGDALSDTTHFVLKHHPDKFLGMLEHLWKHEERLFNTNPALLTEAKTIQASCLCHSAVKDVLRHSLQTTYLPLPALQQQCRDFLGNDWVAFPFLKLEGSPTKEDILSKWLFLNTKLDVQMDDGTRFLFDMLRVLALRRRRNTTANVQKLVIKLYQTMEAKVRASGVHEVPLSPTRHMFLNDDEVISPVLIPLQAGREAIWVECCECCWDAPADMETSYPLKHLYSQAVSKQQMTGLSHFFSRTLSIASADCGDVTGELEYLKTNKRDNLDQIRGNYATTFEKSALIFAVKQGVSGWYKTSDCLWSSTTDIKGKVTLNDDYEDLKEFFVDVLGVKTLTLQMVYDELLQTQLNAPIEDVKTALRSLNALLQTENHRPDPMPLLKKPIFPVRYPDGQTALRTAETEFAVNDNESLAGKFRDQIQLLDFSREEILRLKHLIQWVGLADRYLSCVTRESTSAARDHSTRPVTNPARDIKRKAHAILRIGAHFGSPRYRAGASDLYKLLQGASTFETTGIYSVLRISQNGRSFELETASGDMHLDENDSGLVFYVPLDEEKQEICFLDNMPRSVADWLMRDPTTQIPDRVQEDMVTKLMMAMNASTASVDFILTRRGIITVPIANSDISEAAEEGSSSGSEEGTRLTMRTPTRTRAASELSSDTDDDNDARHTPSSGQSPDHGIVDIIRSSRFASERGARPMSYRPSVDRSFGPAPSNEDAQYLRLLTKVVEAARQATFPSQGAFDMSNLLSSLPRGIWQGGFDGPEVRDRFRSTSQLERDKKIGAVGELYVFEVLSRLGAMPGWSRENWQSTIRRYVTLHHEYEALTHWSGRETADLVYQDEAGEFTSWLLDHGYLDESWRDARPKYYLEVKTTTGAHDVPFYMSKSQYQRMQRVSNAQDRKEVYMILRVFGIENGRIGMRVYVDPEMMRVNGQLEFTGESWSVVPRSE